MTMLVGNWRSEIFLAYEIRNILEQSQKKTKSLRKHNVQFSSMCRGVNIFDGNWKRYHTE